MFIIKKYALFVKVKLQKKCIRIEELIIVKIVKKRDIKELKKMTFVVGITGSIACGKSSVTQYLLTHGYTVLDADKITHSAYNIGTSSYNEVIKYFDCLDNGIINRKKLGAIVFNDPKKKKILENIVHPYVIEELKNGIKACHDDIMFLDIPLLYETHLEYLCDKIIVVYVDKDIQRERLMNRNHISKSEADLLISQQMSVDKKKELADYTINNNCYFEDLFYNIDKVIEVIKDENIFNR
jgi:dephospho-CoA kinase